MEKERHQLTETIVQLTLEMIFLLTGEVYVPETKSSSHVTPCSCPQVSGEWRRSPIIAPLPPSQTPERKNKRLLEIVNKIIELLTGEVPVRCQDVAVYLSMEEREYLEGHGDQYKAAMMEEEPPLTSADGSRETNPTERCLRPLYSQDSAQEEHSGPPDYCEEDVIVIKVDDIYDDRISGGEERFEEEEEEGIPVEFIEGKDERCSRNVPDECPVICLDEDTTPDSPVENSITTSLPPELLSSHPRCFLGQPHPVTHHTVLRGCGTPPSSQYTKPKTHVQKGHFNRRTQTGAKKFECAECGKCFTQTSHLVTHRRIHTGEKPHSCSVCGKCFNDKSYLVTHQKIHTGEKPYTCSDCGKAFAKRSNLVRHRRIHTGEKPYSCSECGKCFTWKPSLLYHQIKHSNEKPDNYSDVGSVFYQNHFQ